jgi:protein farnesyltransferase/geranylgeranyltransferase type-1 subunit alpha
MPKYAESPAWSDIEPIPQDDGPGQPLAAIAYTEAYSEGMSYLRAVMANNEMSERVLELTEDIIQMNPAHYTVWYVFLPHPSVRFGIQQIVMREQDTTTD